MKTLTESILGSNGAGLKIRAEKWCEENLRHDRIWRYTVDDRGVISGGIKILTKMDRLPDWIRWGEIEEFACNGVGLETLKNCPQSIRWDCYIHDNKLKTLEGGPRYVGAIFNCEKNQLKSLEDGPVEVGSDYNCSHNQLKSLKGSPNFVKGKFICSYNQLKSLEHCPQRVAQDFDCTNNGKRFTKEEVTKVCNVAEEIKV